MIPLGNGILSPILDSLIGIYGTTTANIGLMISIFWLPSIVVVPIVGYLADRFGRKPIIVPSIFVFGIFGTLIAFTTDFRIALLLRFVQGIGWGGLTALIVTSIGDYYEGAKETTAQGIRQTGVQLVGGTISLLSGLLIALAWQIPFALFIIGIPVAIAVLVWLDEPTAKKSNAATDDFKLYRDRLFRVLRNKQVFPILIVQSLLLVFWIGFTTYISIVVIQINGGSSLQAGMMYALASFTIAISASLIGYFINRVELFNLLILVITVLAIGYIVTMGSSNLLAVGAGAICLGIGYGIALPICRSLLTKLSPQSLRASVISIGSTSSRVMGVLTPIAIGGGAEILSPGIRILDAIRITTVLSGILVWVGACICLIYVRRSSSGGLDINR